MSEPAQSALSRLLLEQVTRDESGQVLLRSKLRAVARRMGFKQVVREQLEIVCNEMVTNQLKFAQGNGLVQLWEIALPQPALDLFALDYGPGIPDLAQARRDGFSTVNTLGKGLGAITRLANESEVYSVPAGDTELPWHGTAVWARFYVDKPARPDAFQFGSCLRAHHDAPFNGDSLAVRSDGARLRWLHLDALGHGQEAHEALAGARDMVLDTDTLTGLLEQLDQRLQGGRGAMAIACEIDAAKEQLAVSGVGEIYAYLICNGQRRAFAFPAGIIGHAHRRFTNETLAFPRQALFITCSDGLRKNWTLGSFPGLWRLHPQLIALLLAQTMSRGNDDRSLFVVRTASK
jgi:anti-sigma regulatory factor (Ser/Thr protein kinase)